MKKTTLLSIIALLAILVTSCSVSGKMSETKISGYVPDDQDLYKAIIGVDSIFWESYNSCNMDIQKKLYSENIEFYHDQSGLITTKQLILDATESSVCGQIRREPINGSIEVYPINGYGAVEMGLHIFKRVADGEPLSSRPGKFIIIWKQLGNEWSISRVISIH